jgi:hypothetical protein
MAIFKTWHRGFRANRLEVRPSALATCIGHLAKLPDESPLCAALVSTDFFPVPRLTGRVLFVLVLLAPTRRPRDSH